MSIQLILGIALLTYVGRALALVLMPHPSDRLRAIPDRIPAPLFASLAATALIDGGDIAPPETLTAATAALVTTPTRSLLWVLVGGLVGYGVGVILFA